MRSRRDPYTASAQMTHAPTRSPALISRFPGRRGRGSVAAGLLPPRGDAGVTAPDPVGRDASAWSTRVSNSSLVSVPAEHGFEHIDHLLAVGVRRPQVAAAPAPALARLRSCHHGASPKRRTES